MGSLQKQLLKLQFYKTYLNLAKDLYELSEPNKITPNLGEMRKRKLVTVQPLEVRKIS